MTKQDVRVYTLRTENRFKLDPAFVRDYVGQQPAWGYGLLSYVTYKRTYARRVTAAQLAQESAAYGVPGVARQTTEEYWQTCVRVVEGVSSILKQHVRDTGQPWSDGEEQHHAQEMFRRMWAFKFTPPGRGLWGMGTDALERKGSAILNNCFVGAERIITKELGAVRLDEAVDKTVTVLTPDGWSPAVVRSFGEQAVQDVTFAPADFTRNANARTLRSNLRTVVRVTPNHRWITCNRGEVTDLRVGDAVLAQVNRDTEESTAYRDGRIHGLIFGDGTAGYQHVTSELRAYHIRLCGEKAQAEVGRFENVTYPPSYNGDPYCHVTTSRELKKFPDTVSPDYLRGFLDGWIVADGTVKPDGETFRLASQHPDAATWLQQNAAAAGWLLTGSATDKAVVTNFGPRTHPITAYSLTRQRRAWVVTQIAELEETEPVYCAQVPSTRSFVLASGIHTGNCGFVSTERLFEDFSEPFCTLMDYSMLGVGMGFDLLGAGRAMIRQPAFDNATFVIADTREGWIEAVRIILDAYVGIGILPCSWDYSKIRKEGLPLKTFGGTASGPGPLMRLLTELDKLCQGFVGRFVDSAFITDVMNLIGVCVVAGNVRRSSEISLGDANDEVFLGLKNNEGLNALFAKQYEIASQDPTWQTFQKMIDRLIKHRPATLTVLDPEYAAYQSRIDRVTARQTAHLKTIETWAAVGEEIKSHPLMTHRWASNNTVMCEIGKTDYAAIMEHTLRNGEPGYAWPQIFKAFGRVGDPADHKDKNAKGFNPCGEQTLHDKELCCLVETYPTKHATLDDFLLTLKYAYRYAKAVTLVPTHNKKTNAVMVRNRRIGTSMAGIAEMYSKLGMTECTRWWDAGYKEICVWDVEYSSWLGVNESIKKTSIKPGGTTPLLVGVEGGLKLPTAPYYMRTIRIDHISPLIKALQDAGYRVEKDRTTPRTMVAYFPCKAPDGVRLATDTSVWEQAAIFTALQATWSDNMVSATLTFQSHEAQDLARIIQMYEGQWKCVSFLPLSTHGFLQAPYTPCTKEQYENARAKLSPVTFDGLTVGHDTEDKFCSGGICEIGAGK